MSRMFVFSMTPLLVILLVLLSNGAGAVETVTSRSSSSATLSAAEGGETSRAALRATTGRRRAGEGYSVVNFEDWDGTILDEDPLSQVNHLLDKYDQQDDQDGMSFLEVSTGVGKVHAFCEICILIMQMKERGQPHLCAGLNPDYFISCVENLESLLRADKAVTYWLRSGCMHLDREGPEIVKPCPAHSICAWVPNLFADVGIVTPRNELSPLCPRDFKYLPRIPRKPSAASGA